MGIAASRKLSQPEYNLALNYLSRGCIASTNAARFFISYARQSKTPINRKSSLKKSGEFLEHARKSIYQLIAVEILEERAERVVDMYQSRIGVLDNLSDNIWRMWEFPYTYDILPQLQDDLTQAIAMENYETAAVLRDEIDTVMKKRLPKDKKQ